MVVWLFAGGGESEVRGLVPFFQKHFPGCHFVRQTPSRIKPGPKPRPGKAVHGKTGKNLVREIKQRLPVALSLGKQPGLILVFDDLDCRNHTEQEKRIIEQLSRIPGCADIPKFVGFASPELESWIIADWDNSVGKDPDFRSRHKGMKHWLNVYGKVSFKSPESFSLYDPDIETCADKLSEAIIESSRQISREDSRAVYSKKSHTPELLKTINPAAIRNKCPLFRKLFDYLEKHC